MKTQERQKTLSAKAMAFGLAAGLFGLALPGAASALVLTAGDVSVSSCGTTATCIDVNPGGVGDIPLNPVGPTTADIEIDFGTRIVLGDPGFGPPPFPGFPPPANPWEIVVTFATTGDNPGIVFPLQDGDLQFTGLDGGAPDVDVFTGNIDVQSVVLAGGILTWTMNVSQDQAGLAPGLGFLDIHFFDVNFNLGDNATLTLQQVRIDPAAPDPTVVVAEPGALAIFSLGLLGLGAWMRRRNKA